MFDYVNLKITDVDFFCRDVNTFNAEINIGEGNKVLDAKSLLSLINLDFSKPIKVEIITDDSYELERFKDLLRRYGGEG